MARPKHHRPVVLLPTAREYRVSCREFDTSDIFGSLEVGLVEFTALLQMSARSGLGAVSRG
jgi:hypothetical protein